MFNTLKKQYSRPDNVVYMSDYRDPVPDKHLFDETLRFIGRHVHRTVRAVAVRVYLWNKIADSR